MKYRPIAVLFLYSLSFLSCDKWDLETKDFIKVEIRSVEALSMDSVRITGQIQGLIEGRVRDHGFVWSAQDSMPEIPFNEAVSLGGKTTGENLAFADTLALAINTTYTLRAYATLDGATYFYSEALAYRTGAGSVITLEVEYEDGLEIELNGRLSGTAKGIVAVQHGFCWSAENTQPTLADTFVDLGYLRNDEPFSYMLGGLQDGTPYYFRAYAVRSINLQLDTAYGETIPFDVALEFWIQRADFGGGGRVGAVGFSIGQKGYIGTGYDGQRKKDFWEYDPQTDSWAQKADFGGGTRDGAVGFSIGQKGYIGTGSGGGLNDKRKDFWEYDPQSDSWAQKADFGGGERSGAVGFSIGQKGYIGTGNDGQRKKDFWEYGPQTDSWARKADFGGGKRESAVGFSIGQKGYIGTGWDGQNIKDFWEYGPQTDSWAQKADFGGGERSGAVGFSIGQRGYIGTGWDVDGQDKKDFWEYGPQTDSWIQKANFSGVERELAIGFSIGQKGYIGTGRYVITQERKDFWEYDP